MTEKEMSIKRLAVLLKEAGVDRDTALNISLRVRKDTDRAQMIEWLETNHSATPDEISEMSGTITKSFWNIRSRRTGALVSETIYVTDYAHWRTDT